jgi:hypothetical protein
LAWTVNAHGPSTKAISRMVVQSTRRFMSSSFVSVAV